MRRPTSRAHSYGAKPTVYNGRRYASKAEAAHAAMLDFEVRAGYVAFWLPQIPVVLEGCKFIVDFMVMEKTDKPGLFRVVFDEVKGMEKETFKHQRQLWARHGPAPLRIVKRGMRVETIEGRVAPAGEGAAP